MIIKVLVENSVYSGAPKGVKAEHGLSLYIETGTEKILFDTGRSDLFLRNAGKMGINLAEVDYLILSHGHSDHGGGLEHFLKANRSATVWMHREATRDFYIKALGIIPFYVGLDKKVLEKYKERIRYMEEDQCITENIKLFSGMRGNFPLPAGNSPLFVKEDGRWKRDDFRHELLLAVEGEHNGAVLFTGCSHSGIVNMIKRYTEHAESLPVSGVLGGFHLYSRMTRKSEPQNYMDRLSEELADRDACFYTGHCTGVKNYAYMKLKLQDKLNSIHSGQEILFL